MKKLICVLMLSLAVLSVSGCIVRGGYYGHPYHHYYR
jgi:predicted small lipoprotein YifL